jgi:hypothetical protein
VKWWGLIFEGQNLQNRLGGASNFKFPEAGAAAAGLGAAAGFQESAAADDDLYS